MIWWIVALFILGWICGMIVGAFMIARYEVRYQRELERLRRRRFDGD